MPALRLPAAALLFTIAVASGSANAQTTLRLTWTSPSGPKVCEYTTNADGVTMDPTTGALLATGAFAGADCPTATPVSDPVITNGITSADIPTSTTTGATHTITWTASADSCSYAGSVTPATISNWPLSGNVCANAAACAAGASVPVTIPATVGNYKFQLSCTKIGSSVTAVSAQDVAVTTGGGGGDTCVNNAGITRQTFGRVQYNNLDARDTDLTLFENVFGHNPAGANRPFPGTANINQRIMIQRNQYVALKFTVPSNFPPGMAGQFRFEETQPQTLRMSYTISKTCGDFSQVAQAPLTVKCIVDNGQVNSVLLWAYQPSATNACQLVPGETYYMNIIQAPLSTLTNSGCSGTCGNTIQNMKIQGTGWPTVIDQID
ncbi:MAG TPA: hypothetical protein VLF18_00635 [Tahibacter sp.]|uniref:hypothetical protein n=1 Tax=Tahibacter sp. TaxID=2056211 RepID=UPI002C0CFFF2|nr:hypothetical protein [Tahibacter sp.]HSX58679.1 hypothetical protein [Tahibacter sp.]